MLTTVLVSAAVAFAVSELVNRRRFLKIDQYVEAIISKLGELIADEGES